MARKVRILQIPLRHLQSLTNPLLSHWALLIGENELLLEIFPKSSKSSKLKLAPFNKLEVTRYPNIDLNARKSKFKIGIFGQPDTDWTDEAIIEVAEEIIRKRPIYNVVSYNCQSFVNNLADAIANRGVGTKIVRCFTPYVLRPFVYRDTDGVLKEAGPDKTASEAEAEQKRELDFLEDLPTIWGLNPSETTCPDALPDALPEASPGTGECANEGLFRLTDQVYIADYELGNLGDIGVAYDQVGSTAAYVLADIPVPLDPDDLTEADLENLKVACLLAGQVERSESKEDGSQH